MLIDEIVRSCVHEDVATAAVACIGRSFSAEISRAASEHGMTAGAYAAMSVQGFARRGDEAELRAVRTAMAGAQEPVLVGLQRILCMTLTTTAAPEDGGYGSACDWRGFGQRNHAALRNHAF